MKELRQEFIDKAKTQTFKNPEVNGVDVVVWIFRHLGRLLFVAPVIAFIGFSVWGLYMEPKVKAVAQELDLVIMSRVDTLGHKVAKNRDTNKRTFFIVKKMELIQSRTAPPKVVREAEEEIEVEKLKPVLD